MVDKVQLKIDFDADLEKHLRKKVKNFKDYRVRSQALDARGSNRGKKPKYDFVVEVIQEGEHFEVLDDKTYDVGPLKNKPIIVGAGPSGLFCALRLLDFGVPSIIIERGEECMKRMKDIARFWRYGDLNTENNVCYGEGGAGLFSDGKLVTRVKSPHVGYVMKRLVDFGAPEDTAYMSNPHLGSDKMRRIISQLSAYLKEKGCEVHYNTRMDELLYSSDGKKVNGVKLADGRELHSEHVVLATGHSAKEVYHHLHDAKVSMKSKDFAVGVRVEHPSKLMNEIQHGKFACEPSLGTARYRISHNNKDTGRGTYSFCMCPGGYVLSTGTEANGLVVNGMSNYHRNSPWSNSALVVSVKNGVDFDSSNPLNGLEFQHAIERSAFNYSKELASGKEIPALGLLDFLDGKYSKHSELIKSSTPSKTVRAPLDNILPEFVSTHLKEAFLNFDRKMNGFITKEALLLAPETRTSAPITIERDRDTLVSVNKEGLYPCGEGAGYAGGITSSAVDGVNVAMSILVESGKID